jgi:TPR repeat protein
VACQDFTEKSAGFFEVEQQVERGQARWGKLGPKHQALCDGSLACWREVATKFSHERAMYCLGFCYELGRGVDVSFAQAQKWLKKAASFKLREAQSRLGLMLRDGRGSQPNDNGAIRAFRGAAVQVTKGPPVYFRLEASP